MGAGSITKWMRTSKLFMIVDNNFKKKFQENLSQNVNLSNYSWFNLGGNAEYFYKANNINNLIEFLRETVKKKKIKDNNNWCRLQYIV